MTHFDFLAPFYEKFIPPGNKDEFIRLLELPIQGKLIDAGGGTGRIAQLLAGRADEIIIIDPSNGMLKEAAQKGLFTLINCQAEAIPLPNRIAQRIIMVDALHHVFNHQAVVNELWRLLERGGKIVIEEPNFDKIGVKIVALGEKIALMRSHFLNPKQIADLFKYFPDAKTNIRTEKMVAWIIVDKQQSF
jgi:ubiquinone/menaquinone biosynthesis C-methylase UbiE